MVGTEVTLIVPAPLLGGVEAEQVRPGALPAGSLFVDPFDLRAQTAVPSARRTGSAPVKPARSRECKSHTGKAQPAIPTQSHALTAARPAAKR